MIRLAAFLAAVTALLGVSLPAHASLSSGLPAGPVGTPVLSTMDYVARSDVMIVGDSISVRSYKQLQTELGTQRLAVNARSGRNTTLSVDSLFKQLQAGMKLPPVLVMAVGANDIFRPGVEGVQVRRLLAGVPATTRVLWVNVSVLRPGYLFADRVNSGKVNQLIAANCVGSCTVVSWAGFLAGKTRSTYIDSKGVHPTAAGSVAWAKLIAEAVRNG